MFDNEFTWSEWLILEHVGQSRGIFSVTERTTIIGKEQMYLSSFKIVSTVFFKTSGLARFILLKEMAPPCLESIAALRGWSPKSGIYIFSYVTKKFPHTIIAGFPM